MRTRLPTSRSVTHPRIALGQARLTLEFFSNELPEKKLQLVGMGFLSILLSHASGSHIHPPLEDRRPRRSTTSQERPLLAHVCASSDGTLPCRVHSGPHAPCYTCLPLTRTRPCNREDRL